MNLYCCCFDGSLIVIGIVDSHYYYIFDFCAEEIGDVVVVVVVGLQQL
jgi:hypothetical protein